MGTRGYLGFIVNGTKHCCYVHYDSYPAGLGNSIKWFLCDLTPEQLATMKRNIAAIEWVDRPDPPSLHMAHILPVILEGSIKRMPKSGNIGGGEYEYYIDFENETLIWCDGQETAFKNLVRPEQEEWQLPGAHLADYLRDSEDFSDRGLLSVTGLEETLGQGIFNVKEYWALKPKYEELLATSQEIARKQGHRYGRHTQPHLVRRAMFWLTQYPVPDGWACDGEKVFRATEAEDGATKPAGDGTEEAAPKTEAGTADATEGCKNEKNQTTGATETAAENATKGDENVASAGQDATVTNSGEKEKFVDSHAAEVKTEGVTKDADEAASKGTSVAGTKDLPEVVDKSETKGKPEASDKPETEDTPDKQKTEVQSTAEAGEKDEAAGGIEETKTASKEAMTTANA